MASLYFTLLIIVLKLFTYTLLYLAKLKNMLLRGLKSFSIAYFALLCQPFLAYFYFLLTQWRPLFSDHKFHFPGLSTVVIGQLSPHITTEVDRESLFSQAGHLSHPKRSRTVAETFKRLIMANHILSRIYCCI